MYYYYYHKDYYGNEKCIGGIPSENLLSDKETVLYNIERDNFSVDHLYGTDFQGYSSIEEFEQNEDTEYAKNWIGAVKQAIADGMQFPFYIFRYRSGEMKYVAEEEYPVKIDELIEDYSTDYQIGPVWIEEGSITSEQARMIGMYALAREMQESEESGPDFSDEDFDEE